MPLAPTRILLLRHGQSEDNVFNRLAGWSDSHLTDLGRAQAERAAQWIAESFRPRVLFVSPLNRAQQTAEPLVRRTGLPPRLHEDLRELHFGDLDGLTIPEIEERFPGAWPIAADEADLDYGFPNGEVRRAFYGRIRRAYDAIAEAHQGEAVVVVTHGGVISSLLSHLATGDFRRWRDFPVRNCGIVEIQATARCHEIVRWNVVDHLSDLPAW